MNLHLGGATKFHASRGAVFRQLTDPGCLAEAIPGKEEARVLDGSRLEARVRVDLPEAEGPFKVQVAVAEADPPSSAKLTTSGSGAGSALSVTSSFDLLGDSPTWIRWAADAEVTGALAERDHGSLKGLAGRKAEEVLERLNHAVAET